MLLGMITFIGCGRPESPSPARLERPDSIHQMEKTAAQSHLGGTKNADRVYARGIVTLKTGEIVGGEILLQCPGYLTVCFKRGASQPGDSELVSYEEVQSVMLEKSLSEVDPLWTELRKEMTISTRGP